MDMNTLFSVLDKKFNEERSNKINLTTQKKRIESKPKHLTVPRSPVVHTKPAWMQTPYNEDGTTLYICLVNSRGTFHRAFTPSDYFNMKKVEGSKAWMKSAIKEKNILYYIVAYNVHGMIVNGVTTSIRN